MEYKVGGIYTIKDDTYVLLEKWNNNYYFIRLGRPIYQHDQVIKYLQKKRTLHWRICSEDECLFQNTNVGYLGTIPFDMVLFYYKKLVKFKRYCEICQSINGF